MNISKQSGASSLMLQLYSALQELTQPTTHASPAVLKRLLRSIVTENIPLSVASIELDGSHLSSLSRSTELIVCKLKELRVLRVDESVDRDCSLRDDALYVEQ
ncbi:hypothetical protein F4677DRAFT_422366 [Hypoxylon crocopeplum]|nr:hypothetical protein F4677DRAFT_422366 [Hypoxylon crocopeplum]